MTGMGRETTVSLRDDPRHFFTRVAANDSSVLAFSSFLVICGLASLNTHLDHHLSHLS